MDRFTIETDKYNESSYILKDNKTDCFYRVSDSLENIKYFVDELNNLSEYGEYQEYKDIVADFCLSHNDLFNEDAVNIIENELGVELPYYVEKDNSVDIISEELQVKLDFIVNLLIDVYCHVNVHYVEMLGYLLGEAEQLGFNIAPSKTWDYDESIYEFARNNPEIIEDYDRLRNLRRVEK